jgi:hypothetical protein
MSTLKLSTMIEGDLMQVFELAFGRILRMGSRPTQAGDIAEYERCKSLIMDVDYFLKRIQIRDKYNLIKK